MPVTYRKKQEEIVIANTVMSTDGEYCKYIVQELKTPNFSTELVEFYKTYAKRIPGDGQR